MKLAVKFSTTICLHFLDSFLVSTMAEKEPKDASNTSLPIYEQGRFPNLQQFLQHTLSCVNPECLLPHCVNMKLALKHSRGCKKENCPLCQQMKSLASKHSESCMDLYCCLPFCMEEKLKGFVNSQFGQIDDSLEADPKGLMREAFSEDKKSISNRSSLSNSSEKWDATTPHITERCSSLNLGSSKGEEGSTPNQNTSTQEFPLSSLYRTNSYPSVNLKRMNRSPSLNVPSTFPKSARLNSEHRRCESLLNENVVAMDTSQPKPIPASRQDLLRPRAQTMPSPLFAVKESMPRNTATKTQSLEELSTSSNLQSEDALDHRASQRTNLKVQKTSGLLDMACSSSGGKASHLTRSEEDISFNTNVTEDSQTMLKARLVHTVYKLLHLIMQKMERKEDILICINSLRNALHQIKTLLHD